ncbi:protein MID1-COMPLEMENTING ACTIVITY 2 [Prunus yedoensis var. nudiflora]|uniref:Protein MID1-COMPLEMENTING ACTIVITY 2 n=1 Tax=Prunus yedoensis var. nudiflora TaxID=2094558 RepID=A0A314XYM9_PRUYE|nr:protein MID1-COMPLEMENTING ACTIVITY 2 [Prunus yedoensis var. nudiflora]
MLAMGWSVVYQFRQVQAEIDRHLSLLVLPMISLLHEFRLQNLKEGLQAIEEDQRMYTLEEEDMEAQNVEEKEKLNIELQRSRTINDDPDQCRVIEHLIDVAENVVSVCCLGRKLRSFLSMNQVMWYQGKCLRNWEASLASYLVGLKHFMAQGSSCDDFFTHLMCCCCAMVQEQRELELRNFEGCRGANMIVPPSLQCMNA